jgi:hypothetical protein
MAKNTSAVTTLDDEPSTELAAAAKPSNELPVTDHGGNFSGKRLRLTIQSGEGVVGRQAVFVGVNTVGFNIPRDTPVIVPEEVVQQLKNCVQVVYEPDEKGVQREREVSRFSITVEPV